MAFCRHCGAPLRQQNAGNAGPRGVAPGMQNRQPPYGRPNAANAFPPAQGNRAPGAAPANPSPVQNTPAGRPAPVAPAQNGAPNFAPGQPQRGPMPGMQNNFPAPAASVTLGGKTIALPAFLAGVPVVPVAVALIALLLNFIFHFLPMVNILGEFHGSMIGLASYAAKEEGEVFPAIHLFLVFAVLFIFVGMFLIVLPILRHRPYKTVHFLPAILFVIWSFILQMAMVLLFVNAAEENGGGLALKAGLFFYIIDTIATVIILIICAKKAKAASQVRGPMNPPMMNDPLMSGGMDQRWS